MDITGIIKNIVPITLFNKGKSSQIFSRITHNETLVVVKNNSPIAIISSPTEYELLRQLFVACKRAKEKSYSSESQELISELTERIKAFDENEGVS